jgi:hypothetical protein
MLGKEEGLEGKGTFNNLMHRVFVDELALSATCWWAPGHAADAEVSTRNALPSLDTKAHDMPSASELSTRAYYGTKIGVMDCKFDDRSCKNNAGELVVNGGCVNFDHFSERGWYEKGYICRFFR